MPNKKTILIDFDGVLSQYDGWKGEGILGEPMEGARAACFSLAKHYKLVIFTTRSALEVKHWIAKHGFACIDHVTNIKVPAFLQIDDRSIQFKGRWDGELLEGIKHFKPWWEVPKEGGA